MNPYFSADDAIAPVVVQPVIRCVSYLATHEGFCTPFRIIWSCPTQAEAQADFLRLLPWVSDVSVRDHVRGVSAE